MISWPQSLLQRWRPTVSLFMCAANFHAFISLPASDKSATFSQESWGLRGPYRLVHSIHRPRILRNVIRTGVRSTPLAYAIRAAFYIHLEHPLLTSLEHLPFQRSESMVHTHDLPVPLSLCASVRPSKFHHLVFSSPPSLESITKRDHRY